MQKFPEGTPERERVMELKDYFHTKFQPRGPRPEGVRQGRPWGQLQLVVAGRMGLLPLPQHLV